MFLYKNVLGPISSSLYGMLAFYLLYASFRTFRAWNMESTLLLASAIVVLVARASIGSYFWDGLPAVAEWLLGVPNAAEYLLVGVGAGYTLVLGWQNVMNKCFLPLQKGHLAAFIPAIIGLLLFTKLSRKASWVARYPMAFMVSLGAGVAVRSAVHSDLMKQIGASMVPLNSLDNIILVVGTMSVTSYFFFTLKTKNPALAITSKVGRAFLMVAFGAMTGSVAMLRTSLFIGRMNFVLKDWLGILK